MISARIMFIPGAHKDLMAVSDGLSTAAIYTKE